MDVSRHVGLTPDVPLEDATQMDSLGAQKSDYVTSETPEEEHLVGFKFPEEEFHFVGFKTPEEEFHSVEFKTDVTEAFVAALIRKVKVLVANRRYFGWKGVGFQCGVCYESVPTHITLTICSCLMRKDPPELMRKDPHELLTGNNSSDLNNGNVTKTTIQPDEPLMRKDPPELLTSNNSSDSNNGNVTKTTIQPDQPFVLSLLAEPFTKSVCTSQC